MGSHGACIDSYCKGNLFVIRLQVYVEYKMTSFHIKHQFCFVRRCVFTFPLTLMTSFHSKHQFCFARRCVSTFPLTLMTSFHFKHQFCFVRRCVSTLPLSSMITRPQPSIPLHDLIIFRCLQITPIFLKESKTSRMYKPKQTEERKKTILASPPSPEHLEPTSDFYKSLLPLLCNPDVKTTAHMITCSSCHADTDKQTHTHTHAHAHVQKHTLIFSQ